MFLLLFTCIRKSDEKFLKQYTQFLRRAHISLYFKSGLVNSHHEAPCLPSCLHTVKSSCLHAASAKEGTISREFPKQSSPKIDLFDFGKVCPRRQAQWKRKPPSRNYSHCNTFLSNLIFELQCTYQNIFIHNKKEEHAGSELRWFTVCVEKMESIGNGHRETVSLELLFFLSFTKVILPF